MMLAPLLRVTFSAVCAGTDHTAALVAGEVWLWGRNSDSQVSLEDGAGSVLAPKKHPAIQGATRIALGAAHSCALATDGQIYCWGQNGKGQLGNGDVGGSDQSPAPVVFP